MILVWHSTSWIPVYILCTVQICTKSAKFVSVILENESTEWIRMAGLSQTDLQRVDNFTCPWIINIEIEIFRMKRDKCTLKSTVRRTNLRPLIWTESLSKRLCIPLTLSTGWLNLFKPFQTVVPAGIYRSVEKPSPGSYMHSPLNVWIKPITCTLRAFTELTSLNICIMDWKPPNTSLVKFKQIVWCTFMFTFSDRVSVCQQNKADNTEKLIA